MTTDNATTAFTYGWDTAFGIPVPDANKAIVDKKSSPPDFSYAGSGFKLSSNFGNWQIANGGSGKNIRFSIPLVDVV
ncbi:MAG: TULIP family P47-like protein, partial [Bacteroidota bacterium]